MSFGFQAPTNSFSSDVEELINEMEDAMGGANPDPDGARQILADIRDRVQEYTGPELASLYRESYRDGDPTLALTPQASRRSKTIRDRFNRNGNSAVNDLDQWIRAMEGSAQDREAIGQINKIRAQQRKILSTPSATAAQKAKAQQTLELANEKYKEINRSILNWGDPEARGPTVGYRRRRKGKGIVYQRQSATGHFRMLQTTSERDIINDAYIKGRVQEGTEWFIVSDGASCGWSYHRDPEKANGKVVHYEDVITYGHPNCVRRFEALPDGPWSKRTERRIQEITGFAKSFARGAAKTASMAGHAYAVGTALQHDTFIRRTIRAILEDKEIALRENVQKILDSWVNNYERFEVQALGLTNTEVNTFNLRALRGQVIENIEGKIEKSLDYSDLQPIRLREEEMRVLGYKSRHITRVDLIDRLDDYADYVRHQEDKLAGPIRSVGAAAQDEGALRAIYGPNYIKRAMTRFSRGGHVVEDTKKLIAAVDRAVAGQGARAEVDLIKLAVTALEPMPWLRAAKAYDIGQFRFSVGMTAEGRRNLARTLYLRMRGQEFREAYSRSYQRNALGNIMKQAKITPQLVYDSLLPRITFLGNPVHATIFAEKGKIIPVIQTFPSGAFLKHMSFRFRLTSNSIDDWIKIARYNYKDTAQLRQRMATKLRQMPEDMIMSIDIFRNGPIQATARFLHDGLDTFAIKLKPDGNAVRGVYRFYNREVKHRTKAITVLPRSWGGEFLDLMDIDVFQMFLGLWRTKGSLTEVGRVLGVKYDDLVREVRRTAKRYGIRYQFLKDLIKQKANSLTDYGVRYIGTQEMFDAGGEIVSGLTGLSMKTLGRYDAAVNPFDLRNRTNAAGRLAKEMKTRIVEAANKTGEYIAVIADAPRDFVTQRGRRLKIAFDVEYRIRKREVLIKLDYTQRFITDAPQWMYTRSKAFANHIEDLIAESTNFEIDMTGFVYVPEYRWPQVYSTEHIPFVQWHRDLASPYESIMRIPRELHKYDHARLRAHIDDILPGDTTDFVNSIPREMLYARHRSALAEYIEWYDYMEKQGIFRDGRVSIPDMSFQDLQGYYGVHDGYANKTYIHSAWLWDRPAFDADVRNAIDVGNVSSLAANPMNTFMHEYGHQMTINRLEPYQKMELWNEMMDGVPWEGLQEELDFGDFLLGVDVSGNTVPYDPGIHGMMTILPEEFRSKLSPAQLEVFDDLDARWDTLPYSERVKFPQDLIDRMKADPELAIIPIEDGGQTVLMDKFFFALWGNNTVLGRNTMSAVREYIQNEISLYGTSNTMEFWAETFVQVMFYEEGQTNGMADKMRRYLQSLGKMT